ncbi:MAG: hypothetical protein GY861_11105, partial [bacterium]|nr:hypothetical protein [bacterium]
MPKSWKETIATDQYKAGTTEQKQEWKNKYFNEVCAPEFDKGQVAQKRKEFYAYADKLEPKQPKWTQDVSDIYMSGFTGKSMTPPKPPTPVPDWKAKYGEFYKESPEWQQHPKGGGGRIETPFIDPVVDPIMGGVFGLKHGLKAGLKGAELIKNVAREAWSDFTFGGSDIAGGLTKKALRKFSGKKVEKFVPVTGTDEIGMKVADMFKETDKAAKDLYKVKRAEKFRSRWVDVSGNIKKKLNAFGEPGKEVVMKHDLTLGSSAKANEIVNDAFDRIYKGLNSNQERILNNIIQSNRTSGIGKYKTGVSSPKGFDGIDNKIYYDGVDKFERIPLQEAEMLKQRAAEYHNIYRESLREQYRNGILTQENIEALMEKGDYSPRRYIHHIDPDGTFGYGGKKIEAKNTGIKSLESGSEELLEKNSRLLLADSINLHQALIFKNKANQSLYKFARELPDNGFVKIHKGEAPSGYDPLNVFFKGNKTQLIMKSDIAKGWVKNDPVINSAAARAMEWASGTKILKAMATGYNPEFAI